MSTCTITKREYHTIRTALNRGLIYVVYQENIFTVGGDEAMDGCLQITVMSSLDDSCMGVLLRRSGSKYEVFEKEMVGGLFSVDELSPILQCLLNGGSAAGCEVIDLAAMIGRAEQEQRELAASN